MTPINVIPDLCTNRELSVSRDLQQEEFEATPFLHSRREMREDSNEKCRLEGRHEVWRLEHIIAPCA